MRVWMPIYDDPGSFRAYSRMDRSRYGLSVAGEWHRMEKLFPELTGAAALELGCGYGADRRDCPVDYERNA